jgi:DNA-binding XRE family transcriptional regulator
VSQFFPAENGKPPSRKKRGRGRRAWGSMPLSTLGGRVQAARVHWQMTQRELADEIGTSRNTIAAIEMGKDRVSLGRAVELARALDVSLEYLAGLTPEFGTFPMGDEEC